MSKLDCFMSKNGSDLAWEHDPSPTGQKVPIHNTCSTVIYYYLSSLMQLSEWRSISLHNLASQLDVAEEAQAQLSQVCLRKS